MFLGITVSQKTISPMSIQCNELARVTLSLTAAPNITQNPVDIMLVLDRSGSMSGNPLALLKAGAIEFIDIIKEATNPGNPGATNIGFPNRMGIVSFAANATLNTALTEDVDTLKATVNALTANGNTNHEAAFNLGATSYTPVLSPANRKIMVMFTDGDTTAGGDASQAALNARNAGIEIYLIGLGNNIDVNNLNDWASDPDTSHVIIAPTPEDLKQAFEDIAANITKPGALGIEVVDTIQDEFEIVGQPTLVNPATTLATASVDGTGKVLTWTLDQLGVAGTEGATVTFFVRYLRCNTATLPVNKSVVYTDQSVPTNQVNFTGVNTEIAINCDADVIPDCCEPSTDITFLPCDTMLDLSLPNQTDYYNLKCDGRILSVRVRLNNICPGRRVALGIIATEVIEGIEYSRGFKAITVPEQQSTNTCPCATIIVDPVVFIFPEDMSPTPGICSGSRLFRVRLIAHYIDTGISNFNICPIIPIPPVPVFK